MLYTNGLLAMPPPTLYAEPAYFAIIHLGPAVLHNLQSIRMQGERRPHSGPPS